MYRAYVVDDDVLILGEIVERVPWMENGFEICGFSKYPNTAIDEICQLCPDVVFTDLKMPGMDGLALIVELQERGVSCEFVMISAYSAFADSRSFFLLQGFDYLLKPLDKNEIQLLLQRLYKRLLTKNPIPVPSDPSLEDQNINPAFLSLVTHAKEHYNQKLSLRRLSDQFDINANYVCNLFAKHYNTTFTRFITDLRMKAASSKILSESGALKVIALECGYSDYYYFCKCFREYFGMSPSEHRAHGVMVSEGIKS